MKKAIVLFIIFQALSVLRIIFFDNDNLFVKVAIALAETVFGILFLINSINYFLKNSKKIKSAINVVIIIVAIIFFLIYVILLY